MKRKIVPWSARELYANREYIQYPDFEREPTVWVERKKQLLIDSMLIGLDIPKIYLYSPEDDMNYYRIIGAKRVFYYDCVDGQQRIVSVIEFFSDKLKLKDGRYWHDLDSEEKQRLLDYEFTIALITKATDDELRLLFLRLQLGAPLNVGEKLHAMKGDMKDFVFEVGAGHPFFDKVSIPKRRYARETVLAQICINSFYRSLHDRFYSARYEDLKAFFDQSSAIGTFKEEVNRIVDTLDKMDSYFGEKSRLLNNRASVVTGYLFFEELLKNKETDKLSTFTNFYFEFLAKLSEQTSKGLDYDREYREILDFHTHIIQAAVGRYAIESRHKILKGYFEHYLETGEIRKANQ